MRVKAPLVSGLEAWVYVDTPSKAAAGLKRSRSREQDATLGLLLFSACSFRLCEANARTDLIQFREDEMAILPPIVSFEGGQRTSGILATKN